MNQDLFAYKEYFLLPRARRINVGQRTAAERCITFWKQIAYLSFGRIFCRTVPLLSRLNTCALHDKHWKYKSNKALDGTKLNPQVNKLNP